MTSRFGADLTILWFLRLAFVTFSGFAQLANASGAEPSTTVFETQNGWIASRQIVTPYATQAAAADGHFLYAISSTTVAKFARSSGHLLATATTPTTKHLNSGYLHDGKLYCGHSNYPNTPHESDIRVFDPRTNSLSVYHTFANPPGSLVWCIRKDGRWWCCFAHYGQENHRTVLIEYTEGGLTGEARRFLFPQELIADFDGMSASGGIWDGDTILASHHHYPVLYRLRVPADREATMLELVETLACPFPGQGIAVDPAAAGGLVGIDRPARAIVVATPVTPPCCEATPRSRRSLLLEGPQTP